jgi:hypothetical protein
MNSDDGVPVGERDCTMKRQAPLRSVMVYRELEPLSDSEFKRLCGLSRGTFAQMVEVLGVVKE